MAKRSVGKFVSDSYAAITALFERSKQLASQDPRMLTLLIGGERIRLVSAGPTMLDFVGPALAHLPRLPDDEPADLTVTMWDAATTGAPYPDLRLPEVEPMAAGLLDAPELLLSYYSQPRLMTVLDRNVDEALFIADTADALPPSERPSPMRALLSWWFTGRGKLVAHAAAVATDVGAALLIGPGGSGKSSTSLACMAAGMGWLGDDYVIIDPRTRTVFSLYGSAKLVAEHHDRYPTLMRTDGTIHHGDLKDKNFGFPAVEFPDRVCLSSEVRAVVLPVVTRGPECLLARSTPSRALLALAPSTIFQGRVQHAEVFGLSCEVLRPFEPYRLELGDGVAAVPQMLAQLIAAEGRP